MSSLTDSRLTARTYTANAATVTEPHCGEVTWRHGSLKAEPCTDEPHCGEVTCRHGSLKTEPCTQLHYERKSIVKKDTKKERFYKEMRESLLARKTDEMKITFRRVTKNNRKDLHAVLLELPDSAAAPTFYLEDLYEAFENGTAAEDIADSLISFAKHNRLGTIPGNIDIDDFDHAKKNLGLCVLGIERNREYLSDMVYEEHEDLALVPMIFTNDYHGPGHIKVRKDFLKLWNVTEEEVMRQAMENSPKLLPLTFRQLNDTGDHEPGEVCELFVISNAYFAGGAAVAFYPRVLECIGMALGRDLFVLPSSINEMIVVTDTGQDPENLLSIVREVNRTQVAPEEVLTDSVYYYNRKTDELRRILPELA